VRAPAAAFDGEDLSQALAGRRQQRRKPIFWEYQRSSRHLLPGLEVDRSPSLAIRDGRWKLLMNPDGSNRELHDPGRSALESDNVAARNQRIADRLSRQLLAWRRSLPELR
jgi:hypothetical protein